MKSRFFTDTRMLDALPPPDDKVCVCLILSRTAYERALHNARELHITSGAYIDRLILEQRFSDGDTKGLPPADSPWQRFPPAPPDH